MAFDTKAYVEELLKAAGTSDEATRQAVTTLFGNEAVAKYVEGGQMRQSDYSRNMDKLAAESKRNTDYYNQLVTWKAEQDAAYAGLQPDPYAQRQTVAQGDYISKKDFEKWQGELNAANQQREANFITITKKVGRLSSRHANEFHEELDTDKLEQVVKEHNVDLDRAYDLMVADRRKVANEAAQAARDKRIADDAVRAFASSHQIPVDSTPKETGVYGRLNFSPDKSTAAETVPFEGRLTPAGYNTLKNSFVEEWNKAAGGNSSSQ